MDRIYKKLPFIYIAICCFGALFLSFTGHTTQGFALFLIFVFGALLLARKGALLGSLLFLIFIFPLNISYQIPSFIDNAFVSGRFVNYLSPTIYLVGVAVGLIIITYFSYLKIDKVSRNGKFIFISALILWIVHNLIFREVLVFVTTSRILLYLATILVLYENRDLFIKTVKKGRSTILKVLVIVLAFQLILAINQILAGADTGLYYLGESDVAAGIVNASSIDIGGRLFLRGYGTFPHPNVLGGFAALVFTLSGIFYWIKREIKVGYYVIISLLSISIALVTFSQAAWLVVIVNGVLLLLNVIYEKFLKDRRKGNRLNSLMLSIPVFLTTEDRSVRERVDLISSTWLYFKDNYIFGVGGGNFIKEFYPYAPESDRKLSILQPVHNIYLLILVEYGSLYGVFLGITFMLLFLLRLIRTKYKLAIISLFLFVLIIGMVDHYLITLPQGLVMLLTTILIASLT